MPLLASIRSTFPGLGTSADGSYARAMFGVALEKLDRWNLEIAKRSDDGPRFKALPRRGVVECTFA